MQFKCLVNTSAQYCIAAAVALLLTLNAQAAPTVKASPVLLKMLTIEAVTSSQVQDSLRLSARIDLDQTRVARIGASVTGRVTEINAMLGTTVKKGSQLAMLNSTELGRAQSDYLKASTQVNLRQVTVKRAERLKEGGVLSEAEYQERKAVLTEAEVDLRAARDQLKIMGMSEHDLKVLDQDRNIHSFSPVTSNIEGVVIERNIAVGQVVQPADSLYTVADLSRLWLVAEVPEQQAHWAHEGDQVQAEIPALPELEVVGKLIYVADLVNPETRTVMVRMELTNPDRLFKPNMLAALKITKPGSQSLVIPSQAIVREGDQDYVFVEQSADSFELRPVKLGREENRRRPLLSGIKSGDRIVVNGSFHLNNERLKTDQE